jgi:hydrogenase maturation protein HypF
VARAAVLAEAFSQTERTLLVQLMQRGVLAPVTTSAGRLFDAVASLVSLKHKVNFEGQAAMLLEHAIDETERGSYVCGIERNGFRFAPEPTWQVPDYVVDWEPMIAAILRDVADGVPVGTISGRFHNALANAIAAIAAHVGEPRVVLTGGCFQNRVLTERTIARLREEGFKPYWHQRVPPNDGGLSLGQIAACLDPAVKVRAARGTPEEEAPGVTA